MGDGRLYALGAIKPVGRGWEYVVKESAAMPVPYDPGCQKKGKSRP